MDCPAPVPEKVALCRKVPVIEGWTVIWFYFFLLTNLFQNHIIFCLGNRLREFEPISFSFDGFRNQVFKVYMIVKLKLKL